MCNIEISHKLFVKLPSIGIQIDSAKHGKSLLVLAVEVSIMHCRIYLAHRRISIAERTHTCTVHTRTFLHV